MVKIPNHKKEIINFGYCSVMWNNRKQYKLIAEGNCLMFYETQPNSQKTTLKSTWNIAKWGLLGVTGLF